MIAKLLLRPWLAVLFLAAASPLLAQEGRIEGRVTAADGGAPIAGCTVHLVPSGQIHATVGATCREDGTFEASAPPGSYSLVAFDPNSEEYARHLWGFGPCNRSPINAACMDLEKGTPVVVRSGQSAGFFAMELERTAEIGVSVEFAENPRPVAGRFRIFEEDGQEIVLGGLVEQVTVQVAPGSYRLVVEGAPDWQSYHWGNVPCSRWHCEPQEGEAIVLGPGERASGSFLLQRIAPYEGCVADASTLCLNQGRFEVRAIWRDYLGVSGAGIARQITADSGYFYFFTPNNVEVLAKALNACDHALGHRFYFFAGGLTDVQVELRVKDTLTGDFELYTNRLGTAFDPILDTDAFDTCNVPEPSAALLSAGSSAKGMPAEEGHQQPAGLCDLSPVAGACVTGGRFAVTTKYTNMGYTHPAASRLLTDDTAAFWFFDPNNYEVMLKVLDACGTSTPGFWIFGAGLTHLPVEVKVDDLATGRTKTYSRGPGPFAPIVDHSSFPCR